MQLTYHALSPNTTKCDSSYLFFIQVLSLRNDRYIVLIMQEDKKLSCWEILLYCWISLLETHTFTHHIIYFYYKLNTFI